MKKLLFGTVLLILISVYPFLTTAGVDINISIPLPPPPPLPFAAPPEVVVIPETYVYVVPDIDVDVFFYNGWWWRPWKGYWYRSRHYSSGWIHYQQVPLFYRGIPSGWRNYYREHRWRGHPWHYQRIPQHKIHKNWRDWEKNRYWEKQNTWGVKGLKHKTHYQHQDSKARQKSQKASEPQHSQPEHGKSERGEKQMGNGHGHH